MPIEIPVTSDEESEEKDSKKTMTTSTNTISKYFELFRNLICEEMIKISKHRKISGINTVVEMHESMFGKRKHNQGKLTGRHQWFFEGICRQTRDIFLTLRSLSREQARQTNSGKDHCGYCGKGDDTLY